MCVVTVCTAWGVRAYGVLMVRICTICGMSGESMHYMCGEACTVCMRGEGMHCIFGKGMHCVCGDGMHSVCGEVMHCMSVERMHCMCVW